MLDLFLSVLMDLVRRTGSSRHFDPYPSLNIGNIHSRSVLQGKVPPNVIAQEIKTIKKLFPDFHQFITKYSCIFGIDVKNATK